MRQRTIWTLVISAAVSVLVLISCSKSNNDNPIPPAANGDSALVNIGTNIILPSFLDLATTTVGMDAAISAFTTTPNASTLAAAQGAYKTACLSWASSSAFLFGPASDQSLLTSTINVFPTDSTLIKSNISSGSYTIDGIANVKAQGFPGIDFLLFGADMTTTLGRFTTDGSAANAKKYLSAISSSIKTKAAAVAAAWSSSYLTTFKAATGVNAGSSLSVLLNAFVYDYDVTLKNYKLGIPIGKYGTTVLPLAPEKVEAYYSGTSLQLLLKQVKALQNLYTGGTGYGLDDKVIAVKATKNGTALNDVINAEFATLIAKLAALPDPLSADIKNNLTAVNDVYTEATKLVVLLKVDLSSALGVKISFQDDDGD